MESTEEINNITSQVSSGSAEMKRGIENSNKALAAIREKSGDAAEGVKEINEKAARVDEALDGLKRVGRELDSITLALSSGVDQFIV